MHLIELRTSAQGHPEYRKVCQQMHRLILEKAGHRAIVAALMTYRRRGRLRGRGLGTPGRGAAGRRPPPTDPTLTRIYTLELEVHC